MTPEQVKKEVDRVFAYIDKETPARVVDKNTGKVITNYTTMGEEAQLERGAFRLASYEWGVTYSALIAASEATGDTRYMDYVQNRFRFLAEVAPHFKRVYKEKGTTDPQLLQILTPHALDDAGAVCAAMVKVRLKDPSLPVDELIRNYFDFIINKEYRLADGTFARNRPQHNTLWLDDMFMGIPAVAQMSYYDKEQKDKYLAEAVRQFLQFADRMFIPEKDCIVTDGWKAVAIILLLLGARQRLGYVDGLRTARRSTGRLSSTCESDGLFPGSCTWSDSLAKRRRTLAPIARPE